MGIGALLNSRRLMVPPNQRAYAWGEAQVVDLLNDIELAMRQNDSQDYFLGTVVLVDTGEELPQIADGQQRAATVTIILSRIRDILVEIGREKSAQSIEQRFISEIEMRSEERVAKIQLNNEDDEFFRTHILENLAETRKQIAARAAATTASNRRLIEASDTALAFLRGQISQLKPENQADILMRWVEFLQDRASIGVVVVPDEAGAFRMFETLNDRGLKASQADILKNYLLSKATKAQFSTLHASWSEMSGVISTLPEDEDDNLVDFLRYYWITQNGLTRQRELAASIKEKVKSGHKAATFVTGARAASNDFVALWQPNHSKWNAYRPTTRKHLYTLSAHLKAEQILPLLFAIASYFSPEEADKAFKLCVTWSVRFLIAGQGKAGRLDKPYSERAHEIGTSQIKTARALRDAMKPIVPTDKEFLEAFAVARVSKSYLARYYLRALDQELNGGEMPEYVANEDATQINLEHVVPMNPGPAWDMDRDTAQSCQKLLGNMVLLRADRNVAIGNSSIEDKREAFRQSPYVMTSEVADFQRFGLAEIRQRQMKMAGIAVRTWSTNFL